VSNIKLVVTLSHDDFPDNPAECDGWKLHSFSHRHASFKHPDHFDVDEDKELAAKLKNGLAFWLAYFEHGNCVWSISGEGPQCRWDSVQRAGILIWEDDESNIGAKSYEDRSEDARRFLSRYTAWCNGEVYGYTVKAFRTCECCGQDKELDESEAGIDMPSVGGYYGDDIDGLVIDLQDNIGTDYEVQFTDDVGGWLADEARSHWKVTA